MLVVILGERDKLTGPVLRVLAHPGLTSIRLSGEHARNSILYILKCLTKLTCLEIPAHEISAEGGSLSSFIIIQVAPQFCLILQQA